MSAEEQDQPEASLWRVLDLRGIPFRGAMQDIFSTVSPGAVVGEETVRISPPQPLLPSYTAPVEFGCMELGWANQNKSQPQVKWDLNAIDPRAPLRKICGQVRTETQAECDQIFTRLVQEFADLLGPANGAGGFNWDIGSAEVGLHKVSASMSAQPHVIISIKPRWRPPVTAHESEKLDAAPLQWISATERLSSWREVDRFDRLPVAELPKPGIWATSALDYLVDMDRQNRLRIIPMALIKRVSGHYLQKAKGGGHLYIGLDIETPEGAMRLSVYDLFWDSDRLQEIEQAGKDIAARLNLPFSSNVTNIGFDA